MSVGIGRRDAFSSTDDTSADDDDDDVDDVDDEDDATDEFDALDDVVLAVVDVTIIDIDLPRIGLLRVTHGGSIYRYRATMNSKSPLCADNWFQRYCIDV